MQHDFFLEDAGLIVELVNREDEHGENKLIQMRLRVVDAKKRKDKHKDNEAIQFDFDLQADQPEEIAQDMVSLLALNCVKVWYKQMGIMHILH